MADAENTQSPMRQNGSSVMLEDSTKSQSNSSSKNESNSSVQNGDLVDAELSTSRLQNPELQELQELQEFQGLQGDRIGDTMYSERFVLSTLLKLTELEKDLSELEDYEKDLCNVWDMTIEKDVVKLLLEQKVLEIFSNIIENTEDKRLTEILVGIIANMCNLSRTRDELCISSHIIAPVINLISCSDSLTLIQLMRFFHAALVFENSGDEMEWFQHFKNSDDFIEHFAFILKNSMSHTLLISSLEALNALCSKFSVIEIHSEENNLSFCELFVQSSLVDGIVEAFKTLLPIEENDLDSTGLDETITPTKNSNKIINLFLDVNVILSNYEKISKQCYESVLPDLLKCISKILSPLCEPIHLLPLTINEQGIIENLNELFQNLGDPFHSICFAQMITIWNLIDTYREQKDNQKDKSNGFEDDDDELNDEINLIDICTTILEFVTRSVSGAVGDLLEQALKLHSSATINRLLLALNKEDDGEIKECVLKIKSARENSVQNEADENNLVKN